MHRMPRYFVLPGDYTPAVLVGALNAVRAHDRGDHLAGRAAARLLTDYRPHPTT